MPTNGGKVSPETSDKLRVNSMSLLDEISETTDDLCEESKTSVTTEDNRRSRSMTNWSHREKIYRAVKC